MDFQLLGETIALDPNRENYNAYRTMFQEKAKNAVSSFRSLYKSNTSLEMVIKNSPKQMTQCLQPAISLCVQILIDRGVLSVDEERFMNLYPDILDPINEAYTKIQDQYAEIVLTEEEKDAYRTARRQNRSKWQGGGFGIDGAIKGAATAGMLNAVTGAGHMVFNGLAKIGSSIAASSKIDRIFKDEKTEKGLARGLYRSVFDLHMALVDCLAKTGADCQTINGIVEAADREEASAILRNITRINNPKQQRAAMIQAFTLDPYQRDWYHTALQLFGDQDGSLEEAERFFGLSVIHDEKKRQLNKFAQELQIASEEQAQLAVKKIEAEKIRLGYSGETEYTKAAREAVEHFDVEYQTVENTTFSTREEADASRAELREILKIEQHIGYNKLGSIAEGKQKMEAFSSPLAASHRETLQEKWDNLDRTLRSADTLLKDGDPILCENIEEATELRTMLSGLKSRLDSCGTGISAEQPLLQLKSNLTEMNISSEVKEAYQKEINRRLSDIDLVARTALGKEYPTRDAAKEAQQLYSQLQSDLAEGNVREKGDLLRDRISSADFPEEKRTELLDQLFQSENAREIKASKVIGILSYAILIAIMILSYFFYLSGTPEFAQHGVQVFGISLKLMDIEEVNSLGFIDGLKNGFVVYGRCFGDIFRNGFLEYIGGFDYGLMGNILWGILGIIWLFIKHFFLGIARYLVSLVVTLFQKASIRYYLGYIIGSAVPMAVSQFTFDDENQAENVNRIKSWTAKKIFLALVTVFLVAIVVFLFVLQEI